MENNILNYNSVENIPHINAKAAFTVNSAAVFREDGDIAPVIIDDKLSYMPWGGDNRLPFNVLNLIEGDETLSTCQLFNAEVCYGSGIEYNADACSAAVNEEINDFYLDNDIATYFLGACQDFKHFAFCVSVIILNQDATKIVRLLRKEACYCRFSPVDSKGRITKVLYANWRNSISSREQMAVWRCSTASNMYLILHERSVVNAVRSQIADVLRDKPINHRLMTDCVNTIRRYPDSFPEWHRSATAELYTPKVFKNKKKSGGYWW